MKFMVFITFVLLSLQTTNASALILPPLSQQDIITPKSLHALDSLEQISSTITLPGFSRTLQRNSIQTGFFINSNDRTDNYTWHPLTALDLSTGSISQIAPYFSAEHTFRETSAGIYLGNLQSETLEHNALDANDTINQFHKNRIKLNGALWIKPAWKYCKGLSLITEGGAISRTAHIANADVWKRLHTTYDFNHIYGSGTVSGAFSFFSSDYWILRLTYGNGRSDAREEQHDTLYFSDNNYINSSLALDTSFDHSNLGIQAGHLFRFKNSNCIAGLFVGTATHLSSFDNYSNDSSSVSFNAFFQKQILINVLRLYSGVDMIYDMTYYNRSNFHRKYFNVSSKYSPQRMSNFIQLSVPVFGELRPHAKLALFCGAEFTVKHTTTNFNLNKNISNNFSKTTCTIDAYPLNIRYSPTDNFYISLSPGLKQNIFISSLELSLYL